MMKHGSWLWFPTLALIATTSGCVGVTPSASSILGDSVIELVGIPSETPTALPSSDTTVTLDLQAELKVSAQSGNGLQVKLDEVRVGRANTLLVIQTSSGEVLGTVLLNPGSEPLGMPLTIAVTRTGLLSASLYLDDGDRIFNVARDSIIIDDDGAVMRVFFDYELTASASSPAPSPSNDSPSPSPDDSDPSEDEVESEDEDSDQEDR